MQSLANLSWLLLRHAFLISSLLQGLRCSAIVDHRGSIGMQDDADMRKCIQEVSYDCGLLPTSAPELPVGLGPVESAAPQTTHLLW